jgi:uncharacterized protein YoxC
VKIVSGIMVAVAFVVLTLFMVKRYTHFGEPANGPKKAEVDKSEE